MEGLEGQCYAGARASARAKLILVVGVSSLRGSPLDPCTFVTIPTWKALQETRQYLTRFGEARVQGVSGVDMRECLRTVNYGNYGIFLILGNAGFFVINRTLLSPNKAPPALAASILNHYKLHAD